MALAFAATHSAKRDEKAGAEVSCPPSVVSIAAPLLKSVRASGGCRGRTALEMTEEAS